MPINTLPTPPTRQDPANFADRADTFLAALPNFATEANQLATEVNGNANSASVYATNAQAAATAAQASAGVTLWNPSTTYTIGQTVYSPTSFYTYRRKLAGMSATDPASDSTNWVQVTGTGNVNTTSTTVDMTGTRFSVGGLFGVGTTGPQVKAHIVSASADVLRLESTTPSAVLSFRTSTTGTNPYIASGGDNISFVTSGAERLTLSSAGVCTYSLPGAGVPKLEIGALGDNPYMTLKRWAGSASDYYSTSFNLSGNGDLSLTTNFTGQPTYSRAVFYANGSVVLGTNATYVSGALSIGLNLVQQSSDGSSVSHFLTENVGNLYISSYKSSGSTITFNTSLPNGSVTEKVRVTASGDVGIGTTSPSAKLHVVGTLALGIPVFVSASTYTVTTDVTTVRFTAACTVTLPAASAFVGRIINFVTVNANAIVAVNTSNGAVVPLTSASGGTAILPATSGSCVTLQSDGSNWIAIAGN